MYGSEDCNIRDCRKKSYLNQPSRQDAINWVSAPLEAVSEEIVVKSILCYGISNSMDGSDDCNIPDCIPTAEEEDRDGNRFSDSEGEADKIEELQDSEEENDGSAE